MTHTEKEILFDHLYQYKQQEDTYLPEIMDLRASDLAIQAFRVAHERYGALLDLMFALDNTAKTCGNTMGSEFVRYEHDRRELK